MIEELFKSHNLKLTDKRKEIYEYILNNKKQTTKKDIINKFSKKMDKVTVYRILDSFLKNNLIKENISLNNEIYYETLDSHKHYIRCINCNNKEEIDEEKIKKFEKEVMGNDKIISHSIEFYSICNKCKNN